MKNILTSQIKFLKNSQRHFSLKLKEFAQFNPDTMSSNISKLSNFVNGEYHSTRNYEEFPCPITGNTFLQVPLTDKSEMEPFKDFINSCPRSGLHNPIKNVDRYLLYGQVCRKIAESLHQPEIMEHFVKLIQKVFPKSYAQAFGEMKVTRAFFENFSGDNVRLLARGFSVPGDHDGQTSHGYRWPYGAVSVIAPFNFPLEISCLQSFGALFMGNKTLVKVDSKVSICYQEFLNLALKCGLPKNDISLIHTNGPNMEHLLLNSNLRMTQFTGSSRVGEHLSKALSGKIKLEDAGFDWKITGPDVQDIDYAVYVNDQDCFAISGQKCSAQSLMFLHKNWVKEGFLDKFSERAGKRRFSDLTIVPVMTWNNKKIKSHVDQLLSLPGSRLVFGGKPVAEKNTVPEVYGLWEPTLISIPIDLYEKHYDVITTELFGPVTIVTEYEDSQLDNVLNIMEKMDRYLTAGVVSNDQRFLNKVLGSTLNGVTYAGIKARTTGAPQNHWFGPCGDPRSAGIGTIEAIKYVWSCHREIIMDTGNVDKNVQLNQS